MNEPQQLLTDLARRGIRLEADGKRLRYFPRSAVSPGLLDRLKAHKTELLSACAKRCRQAASDAVGAANRLAGPEWTPTELNWRAMDAAEDRMHDAARAGDTERTEAAAAEYVRVAETCRLADKIHEWKPGTEGLLFTEDGGIERYRCCPDDGRGDVVTEDFPPESG